MVRYYASAAGLFRLASFLGFAEVCFRSCQICPTVKPVSLPFSGEGPRMNFPTRKKKEVLHLRGPFMTNTIL